MSSNYNSREGEYFEYLNNHINGVVDSWTLFLAPVVKKLYPKDYLDAERSISHHDASKYSEEEFDAYCNYFYPTPICPADDTAFDLAWLHHQKSNPHHWQYWVLIRDEGDIVPMDMPVSEICNMLSDWHAFSRRDLSSTAYTWYMKNGSKMILSDNTRKIIDVLIEYLKEPLPPR